MPPCCQTKPALGRRCKQTAAMQAAGAGSPSLAAEPSWEPAPQSVTAEALHLDLAGLQARITAAAAAGGLGPASGAQSDAAHGTFKAASLQAMQLPCAAQLPL